MSLDVHFVPFLLIILFSYSRTTTNIPSDEGSDWSEENDMNHENPSDEDEPLFKPKKKRRKNSNGEQMKVLENFTNNFKETQAKKLELFQKAIQPHTELELFFSSICKTVEKLNPIDQAKLKNQISNIVTEFELTHLEKISQMS